MAAKTEFFFRKTEVEYELVVKYLENLGYWENLLLFWMMLNQVSSYLLKLNKVSSYFYTLGNDIYTGKNFLKNI